MDAGCRARHPGELAVLGGGHCGDFSGLLHLNQYCYGAVRGNVPRIVVAHSDVLSWWTQVKGEAPPSSPWFEWYRQVVQQGLSGATVIVAPSRWMLDALCGQYRVPNFATVIYNGRDPQLFTPQLEKGTLTVGVGRLWDEAKQLNLLAGLADEFHVVIAGAGTHPGELGLRRGADEARFVGTQSDGRLPRCWPGRRSTPALRATSLLDWLPSKGRCRDAPWC